MVVEILEEKLDHDYINYISDIAEKELENCLWDENTEQDRYVKKFEDCPGHWDAMDERSVNKKVNFFRYHIIFEYF